MMVLGRPKIIKTSMNKQNGYAGIKRDSIKHYKGTVKTVLMHILLNCNFQDNPDFQFENNTYPLKRGQWITSVKKIVHDSGLSTQQVRTALNRLVTNKRITKSSTNSLTNRATLITVLDIDKFLHSKDDDLTNQLTRVVTNDQQTSNKPLTTNKNDKNEKNDKKLVSKDTKGKPYGSDDINSLEKGMRKVFGYLPVASGNRERHYMGNMIKLVTKKDSRGNVKKGREWLPDGWKPALSRFFSWLSDKYEGMSFENMETVYKKLKLWLEKEGK